MMILLSMDGGAIVCNMTLCSLIEVYRRFGGTYYLHLQILKVKQANNQQEENTVVPWYTSLIRSRSLDLYQTNFSHKK
jgi:hypothetical protein